MILWIILAAIGAVIEWQWLDHQRQKLYEIEAEWFARREAEGEDD